MPTMIVTSNKLRYGSREMKAGDEFEATDKDAMLLKGVRKARIKTDADVTAETPQAQAAAILEETKPPPNPVAPLLSEDTPLFDTDSRPRRRPYTRRDMKAED